MRAAGRLPILLGAGVAALVLWLSGQAWWAFAVATLGLWAASWVGPLLDPHRAFPLEDRRYLFDRSEGRCEWCGVTMHFESECPEGGCDQDFQADHIVAWSKGGRTMLSNGQALCRRCNLAKSNN